MLLKVDTKISKYFIYGNESEYFALLTIIRAGV